MGFFIFTWAVLIVGFVIHALVDRSPRRRDARRLVELALLWAVVGNGVFMVLEGVLHIGPTSGQIAASIGFQPSMFQWEIGWADIALGVIAIGAAWRVNRGGWLTATVVATVVALWGDAIGHVMQWVAHGNTAPANVYVLPGDILLPAIMVVLLVLYRRAAPGPEIPAARRGEQDVQAPPPSAPSSSASPPSASPPSASPSASSPKQTGTTPG